ncbi:putative transmembrane protein [Leptomonas pyrrhocoris]|uniref:Putative transmembrane protein n=1 Tax=Leptomonas pyrrhocoris TaxID=157538 RepID=A0A0M9FZJ2_LEPPY|nr:putative transmembrane protein [Leptomonas pyrrhocoris]KPA79086.1 putative transmembrane protein [Leptomonas pyrrhocoris]|eukprot:XP_015657525.1 putative transmembrane protein [Leptomonas pyrrhocoris]
MLRLSRLALFIVPSSSSPELPPFLSTKEKRAEPALGDVYRRVMEYDRHRSSSNEERFTVRSLLRGSCTQKYFSGSMTGAATTAAGVALFLLTFSFNIGKPVVDAHREYFSKLDLKNDSHNDGDAQDRADGDAPNPVEEFDDVAVEEEES